MHIPGLKRYILRDKQVFPFVGDHMEWAEWCFGENGEKNRRVAEDVFNDVRVSTVFLGIDHGYMAGELLLFETMVFGGDSDLACERCGTYEEALTAHQKACSFVSVSVA